jgi:hypothetical protein
MADPYLPPQPGSYDPARTARDPSYTEPKRPIPAVDPPRSGFGTGTLVALVFVVVAILAAVFFRPDQPAIDATAPATEVAPADDGAATTGDATVQPEAGTATIDPTVDPAADPGAVAPEAGSVDPTVDPAADPGAADPATGTTDPATPPASGTVDP